MVQPIYGTLQQLFANRVFKIPVYQRFYSWKKKQREDLFHDIEEVYRRGGDDHHFMATIVCHKTDESSNIGADSFSHYDIVDGQQRITTIIILLKCLELTIEDEDEKRRVHEILVKGDDGNSELILLQTNNSNQYILNRFIREGRDPVAHEIERHSDKNIKQAISDCFAFIRHWRESYNDDVLGLLRVIKNNLGFVIFDTNDQRAVYSIFEVLNSRGLSVDWLDKCKSSLMGVAFETANDSQAATDYLNQLKEIWGRIYDRLALAAVPGHQIMRVCATLSYGASRGKPLPPEEALNRFKENCSSASDAIQISEKLLETARHLVKLDSNEMLGPVTDILHARILAVAIMTSQRLNANERERALEQWERVTFRIFGLAGKDSRHKVGDYVRLAFKVVNRNIDDYRYSDLMSDLRRLGADYPIDKVASEGLQQTEIYEISPKIVRYVLWKYEEYLALRSGQNATVDENARDAIWKMSESESIEHIAPQKPESGGAWGTVDEEYLRNIHRIGNLILLPQSINEEARRQGFQQKKEIYTRVQLRMVSEVCDENNWDINKIVDRENRIIEFAESAWRDVYD